MNRKTKRFPIIDVVESIKIKISARIMEFSVWVGLGRRKSPLHITIIDHAVIVPFIVHVCMHSSFKYF